MAPASLTIGPNPLRLGQLLTVCCFNEFGDRLELTLSNAEGKPLLQRILYQEVVLERIATSAIGKGVYKLELTGRCFHVERHITIT